MTLGEIIRTQREHQCMSQRDLATQVGIDFTYLSKIENGHTPSPSVATVQRIAEALHLNEGELLCYTGKIPGKLKVMVKESLPLARLIQALGKQRLPDTVYEKISYLLEREREKV